MIKTILPWIKINDIDLLNLNPSGEGFLFLLIFIYLFLKNLLL